MPGLLLRPLNERPSQVALRKVVVTNLDRPDTYPTLSETTVRVMGMANRPDASVAEISALVRRDGMLAAGVLRAANSCAVRGAKEIEDVRAAVLRMGLQECCNLLSVMGVKTVYNRCSPAVQERCDTILKHSLFVARLASGISSELGIGQPGSVFTAGLLHDLGRLVACVKCPENSTAAALVSADETDEVIRSEREAWGLDHCEIGHQFATANRLPEAMAQAMLNHHRPAGEEKHRELVALIAVTERMVAHVQRKHNIVGYNLVACPHFPVLARGWPPSRASEFHKALPEIVVQAMRDTRTMLKSCG
ncbi:HDOD domain-containing protein [Gemmata sp. JC717]|uniref:HDOD domain-containing protein n=1 Tax=Gemmata algarum TaxID=2975278 RepID=A0ABU5EV67_9BACT|nr:HDOD domain-containing protein [Gemmata algarum]MDY3553856.1 HDOD domain-containing protein [Gemmata algarum]MDY3559036.1 HDOD domain-containing protein [Gemmata algarum]